MVCQMMGQEDIVGIQRRDIAAAGRVDGGVARRAAALVFLADESGCADRRRRRPRVRDRRLEPSSTTTISKSWKLWASTDWIAVRQRAGAVVDRNDDAEEWGRPWPLF